MPQPQAKKLGLIGFVIDERISREKRSILSRILTAVKSFAELDLMQSSMTEDQMLERLETKKYALLLAPFYRYKTWNRVEAFFGLNRSAGPTFAGYFSEPLDPEEFHVSGEFLRLICLDFANTTTQEATALIRALIADENRTGLKSLLAPGTQIFCESWYSGQGQGFRFDHVMSLPGIGGTEWTKRANAIRICINALWSLIYEEGPGKGDSGLGTAGKTPRAYFQVAVDSNTLGMRLVYNLPSKGSPRDVMSTFSMNGRPTAPAQLLLKFADFVRVHTIPQSADIEITTGFFASAPAEASHGTPHTVWIEPISATTVKEIPFESPGPQSPDLKPLNIAPVDVVKTAGAAAEAQNASAKDRFIQEAAGKIRELKTALEEKDRVIREMRSGGVSTAPPLPTPDIEDLLDAFQERYFEARFQIQEFQKQMDEMAKRGGSIQEIEKLRLKVNELVAKEQLWIRKLAKTLDVYRKGQKKAEVA